MAIGLKKSSSPMTESWLGSVRALPIALIFILLSIQSVSFDIYKITIKPFHLIIFIFFFVFYPRFSHYPISVVAARIFLFGCFCIFNLIPCVVWI